MTIFIISWFVSGLVATIIIRAKGIKVIIVNFILGIFAGYYSLLIVIIMLAFPKVYDKLGEWEI